MTAQLLVNRKLTTYNLTETTVGPNLQRDLIARGFDGTCWIGNAVTVGKQTAKVAMFYRTVGGEFQSVL